MRALLIGLLFTSFLVVGCGEEGHQPDPFETYQACFDEHVEDEMLMVKEAIVVCCADHPIAGARPACGAAVPDCINYLTANLDQTDASTVEVMEACQEYFANQ